MECVTVAEKKCRSGLFAEWHWNSQPEQYSLFIQVTAFFRNERTFVEQNKFLDGLCDFVYVFVGEDTSATRFKSAF